MMSQHTFKAQYVFQYFIDGKMKVRPENEQKNGTYCNTPITVKVFYLIFIVT